MPSEPAPSRPDTDTTEVFTLALRTGEILLRNGASSAAVTRSILAIAHAGGHDDVTANVTLGQITLSYFSDDTRHPVTRVKNVGPTELDMRTLRAVEHLVERVVVGDCTIHEGTERLAALDADDRSPLLLHLIGALTMGAGFAWLLGGSFGSAAVAAGCAVLTEFLNDVAVRLELPTYYARAFSSAVAVAAAALVLAAAPFGEPGVIITASLVTQLVGGASVSAIQDLLTGWLLTACGRIIEATILTVGLVVGTVATVVGVHRLGIPLTLDGVVGPTPPLFSSAAAAGLIALGFCIYSQVEHWALLVLTLLGVLAHLSETLLERADISSVTASSLAAMLMGVLTVVLARPLGWPTSGALDVAVVPLLPGMAFYEGLTGLATHDSAAQSHLFEAIGVALGIGTGAVFGQWLAGQVLWNARRGQMHLRERRSGEVLERNQFETKGLATPDFRRPFTGE